MQRYIERARRRVNIAENLKFSGDIPSLEWFIMKIFNMPAHLRNTCCTDIEEIAFEKKKTEIIIYYQWLNKFDIDEVIYLLKGKGLM